MVERVFDSGDVGGENSIQRQIEFATKISQTLDTLSSRFKEGIIRDLSPKFSIPSTILLYGYDVSEKLHIMAQQTKALHVRSYSLPNKNDRDVKHVSCYVWEIYPPQDGKFPGVGMTVVIPQLTEALTPYKLKRGRKSGSIDVVDVLWFEDGEDRYDRTKPENVLLRVIEKHPTASLKTALWILESLQSAEVIHAEKKFKL